MHQAIRPRRKRLLAGLAVDHFRCWRLTRGKPGASTRIWLGLGGRDYQIRRNRAYLVAARAPARETKTISRSSAMEVCFSSFSGVSALSHWLFRGRIASDTWHFTMKTPARVDKAATTARQHRHIPK